LIRGGGATAPGQNGHDSRGRQQRASHHSPSVETHIHLIPRRGGVEVVLAGQLVDLGGDLARRRPRPRDAGARELAAGARIFSSSASAEGTTAWTTVLRWVSVFASNGRATSWVFAPGARHAVPARGLGAGQALWVAISIASRAAAGDAAAARHLEERVQVAHEGFALHGKQRFALAG
jgi:hypothetical protein